MLKFAAAGTAAAVFSKLTVKHAHKWRETESDMENNGNSDTEVAELECNGFCAPPLLN